MIQRYPAFDGDLGSVSNGYPVYDSFSPYNNPSWTSPEYSGGGGGGTTQPFWVVQPNDPDPYLGPPNESTAENPPAPSAPVPPVKVLPPSAQNDEGGYGNNTVLIGAGVIVLALFLLKK